MEISQPNTPTIGGSRQEGPLRTRECNGPWENFPDNPTARGMGGGGRATVHGRGERHWPYAIEQDERSFWQDLM